MGDRFWQIRRCHRQRRRAALLHAPPIFLDFGTRLYIIIELKAKYNSLSLENPLYLRNALTCYPACIVSAIIINPPFSFPCSTPFMGIFFMRFRVRYTSFEFRLLVSIEWVQMCYTDLILEQTTLQTFLDLRC